MEGKLKELKERFGSEGEVSELDGLSIDADLTRTVPMQRLTISPKKPKKAASVTSP